MIDLPIVGFSAFAFLAQPNASGSFDRPRYETQFTCNIALVLSGKEMMKFSLNPNRFKCERIGEQWIITGKQRSEP